MNVSIKLSKEEEVMMNTLLQMIPKFGKKKERVLAEALRTYYQNQERIKFKG
jgi:lambda repressor-like predicted transcriptional regulator